MNELTAEEFIREKIRIRDDEKGAMNGLQMYDCNGEEALRWAHEFAELKVNEVKASDEPSINNDAMLGIVPYHYWTKRCELAEKCNEESPCDPDITNDQIRAWNEYNEFIEKQGRRDYP